MSEEMRLGTEKEAALRLKQAELDAEDLMRKSRQELAKMEQEITELNRIKERFALKIKGVIEDHLKMLDYEERQEGRVSEPSGDLLEGRAGRIDVPGPRPAPLVQKPGRRSIRKGY